MSLAAYFLDRDYEAAHRASLRLDTAAAVGAQVETFQNRVRFEIASVAAIQKQLSETPDLDPGSFERLATPILENNPDLLYIATSDAAGRALTHGRGDVVPEPAGLQMQAVQQEPLTAMLQTPGGAGFGPLVRMSSGAHALEIRVPVLANRNGAMVHWGTVTGYIDASRFFRKTGLTLTDDSHRLAVRLAGRASNSLEPFFDASTVDSLFSPKAHAVKTSANVVSDTWEFAAVPASGWNRSPREVWVPRSLFFGIGIVVLIPFFRSIRLIKLNARNQSALARREALLLRLTKRLDLALDSYKCGVWESSLSVDDTHWDERMLDLHGVSGMPEWAHRKNWLSIVHPDDVDRAKQALREVIADGSGLSLTVRIVRPDGATRYIRYVAHMQFGQDGLRRLFGIAIDVTEDTILAERLSAAKQETERKNAELEIALSRLSANERNLRAVSERLNLATQAYGCGVWESNLDTQTHYWDARMHEFYNVPVTDGKTNREIWLSHVHPEDRDRALAGRMEAFARGGHYSATYRIMPTPDTIRHLRVVGTVHAQPGEDRKMIGLAVDATEDIELQQALEDAKREAEEKNRELEAALSRLSTRESDLQDLTQRFQLAIQAYGCGIWEANIGTGTAVWDRRMHEYFGIPYVDGQVDDSIFVKHVHPDDLARVEATIAETVEMGKHYSCSYRIVTENGTVRHLRAMGQTHRTADGMLKFIGIALDISDEIQKSEALLAAKNDAEARRAELEAMHAMLQHNATHDPLTGLQNRRALDDVLERLSGEPSDPLKRVTLLHIDLDRFKQINDTLGHSAGDAMLVHAADVLRRNTAPGDLVARIGGDEFVVLLQNNATHREIAALAGGIIESMNVPLDYQGHECRFGVSIGIAREQTRRSSVRQLLVNADIALYRAKAHGRNRFEFFTSNLQAEIKRSKTLADEILRGLENREFVAWYQPQFCARTHRLTGVEALVRWDHPERGILTPDHFLNTAEEINALATIDGHVLEQALADRLGWVARGLVVPKISVNVSARRLRDDQLLKSLRELAITPGQIAFELVESIYLDDTDDIITRNIRRLKSLGIDIEIDDFGTGHTSIVSLLKLEPKRLKIDRQLVQPMLTSSREFSLVRSIIDIGTSLEIETVAEGVESMTHAVRLEEMGCWTLQGYAFAKPMPATDLVDFASSAPWKAMRETPSLATAI
ncbi:bifunctional diguanylate cyclase/phosphodiesterase [Rhizobium aquaticum]|uniref:bifunctional diguanylate cyclase/phosphodiesterase n=1 Tax=Rhizobium aquaticum TaxID=1549636 RepID=UPI003399BA64